MQLARLATSVPGRQSGAIQVLEHSIRRHHLLSNNVRSAADNGHSQHVHKAYLKRFATVLLKPAVDKAKDVSCIDKSIPYAVEEMYLLSHYHANSW
jgi:hypothetical protein